jgi:Tol biopolymer transport system component
MIVSIQPDELVHGPQILPGREAVLFTLAKGGTQTSDQWDRGQIVVQDLKTGKRTVVLEGGTDAHYLPTGHLVYAYGAALFAAPFDASRLTLTGPQVPIIEGVRRTTATGAAQFSFSNNGTLIYVPGATTGQLALALMDRKGNVEAVKLPAASYVTPRISPDGMSVAFGMDDGKEANIWIYDLAGTTSMRQLTYGGANRYPVWTHDGQRIAFQSDREGDVSIFWQTLDSTATPQRLTKAEKGVRHIPDSWSPDDRQLAFTAIQDGKGTIRILSVQDGKDALFAGGPPASLSSSAFSPDQKWIAYQSNDAGKYDIFIQRFPSTGGKQLISKDGGYFPFWSRDRAELFFTSRAFGLSVVSVSGQQSLTFGVPNLLPLRAFSYSAQSPRNIDISPDGQRFIALVTADQSASSAPQIQVVLNWFRELKDRVAVK